MNKDSVLQHTVAGRLVGFSAGSIAQLPPPLSTCPMAAIPGG